MASAPTLIAAARLDSATSLAVFRATLAALSHPGRPAQLPVVHPDRIPPVLLPILALADLEVTIAVLDHRRPPSGNTADPYPVDWLDVVVAATGARPASSPATADLVLALRPPGNAEVVSLRTGDAATPERGARLIVGCARVGCGPTAIHLLGPGASTGRTIHLDGPGPEMFDALGTVNQTFPAGVDTWFIAPDGAIAAIPRSARITHVSRSDEPDGDPEPVHRPTEVE